MISQGPGWLTPADARPFAANVAASLQARGFTVDIPRYADVEPLVCVVAR